MKKILSSLLVPALSAAVVSCGGSESPANPTPTPVPTPTPQPTPTPPPLSVIPACALPANSPASYECTDPAPQLRAAVDAAIDRTIELRPELFDTSDVQGGPKVRSYDAYMTAVVAALGQQSGFCGRIDPEGEIGVKNSNGFSEQWIVVTSEMYVRRHFVGTCRPATF